MKKLLIIFTLIIYSSISGQAVPEKYAKDVQSIDAIMNAYYDVISGSSDDPWQFERDKYIHSPNARITRLDDHGKARTHVLEAEYIPMALAPRENFYEIELKRKTNQFGRMAQVWSAFEIRTSPNKASDVKGLNSIQLHFENNRWYIDSWTAEMETSSNGLVTDFLNEK